MKLTIRPAETESEIKACRELLAHVYGKEYGVRFVDGVYDLEKKVESWPDRHLMALIDGELAGTFGLLEKKTFVEQFGNVTLDDLIPILNCANSERSLITRKICEGAKLAVIPKFFIRSNKIARALVGSLFSYNFLKPVNGIQPLVVACAKLSVYRKIVEPIVNTRRIKSFPQYRIHEYYQSVNNHMESRLVVPEIDVSSNWRSLRFPFEIELGARCAESTFLFQTKDSIQQSCVGVA